MSKLLSDLHRSSASSHLSDRPWRRQLRELSRAFRHTTGWSLTHVMHAPPQANEPGWVSLGVWQQRSLGYFRVVRSAADHPPRVALPHAHELATALASLAGELLKTRGALEEREAELAATAMPRRNVPHDRRQLGHRLNAVLEGACRSLRCRAAGLYLLDGETSHLKLRSAWGLPSERFLLPARRLAAANADLEVLCGHAVVLSTPGMCADWNAPEPAAAAVCVPVATPNLPMGTLWMFSDETREFSDDDVNLIEIIAGRLACELERESLARETRKPQAVAARPHANPWSRRGGARRAVDEFELSGYSAQPEGGQALHEWTELPAGRMAMVVACADGAPDDAAELAGELRTHLFSDLRTTRKARTLLERLNRATCDPTRGRTATAFCATLDLGTGLVGFASAGTPVAIRLRSEGWQVLARPEVPLGVDPEGRYEQYQLTLEPGESLVLLATPTAHTGDGDHCAEGEALARTISRYSAATADELVTHVRKLVPSEMASEFGVLVLKRR